MSGKVTDSIGTPLELANIILIDSDSNTLETFAMSDNRGDYKLSLKKNIIASNSNIHEELKEFITKKDIV